jgi:hypothetical protein
MISRIPGVCLCEVTYVFTMCLRISPYEIHGHYLPQILTSLDRSNSKKPMRILTIVARSN